MVQHNIQTLKLIYTTVYVQHDLIVIARFIYHINDTVSVSRYADGMSAGFT